MSSGKTPVPRPPKLQATFPAYAQVVGELGPKTQLAVTSLVESLRRDVLAQDSDISKMFETLADAFKEGWGDRAADVLRSDVFTRYLGRRSDLDMRDVARWIRIHRGNPEDVIACLDIVPPRETSIIRLLSRAGSQKVVFLANWQEAQREVVVKRFIGDSAVRALPREQQIHPLSMGHPNIIETHTLQNAQGETFLVERKLPEVLSDRWHSHGNTEAANLLRDIASALSFLRERKLVHGDVKPDNIGLEDGAYILLDFGICRSDDEFGQDSSATGSLRTRAPELLLGTGKHTEKSDIWALGATVFNSIVGRFPLFDKEEAPPRISHPNDRDQFEQKLAHRANAEWDQRLDLSEVPEQIRKVLQRTLSKNSSERISAADLVKFAEEELAAFLRPSGGQSMFSPAEEVDQLHSTLSQTEMFKLMPGSEKHRLRVRLEELLNIKHLPSATQDRLKGLTAKLET